MNILRLPTVPAALLAAAPAFAQETAPRPCPHGEADDQILQVSVAMAVHPTRMAFAVDSVLEERGYTVLRRPRDVGEWRVAPRYTWLEDEKLADEHPGVQVFIESEHRGDSTHVNIGARTLCALAPGSAGEEDAAGIVTAVEALAAMDIAAKVGERVDAWKAAGVALATEVERGGLQVTAPDSAGVFRFQRRQDFDDPRLGSSVRYAAPDGATADVYVYPGPPDDESCRADCAAARVRMETDEFVGSFPEFIRRGHFTAIEATSNEELTPPAGALWRAGRHLTGKAEVQGDAVETHFHLFSFAGFMVKVRSTFRPSTERRERMETFVKDLLVRMVSER